MRPSFFRAVLLLVYVGMLAAIAPQAGRLLAQTVVVQPPGPESGEKVKDYKDRLIAFYKSPPDALSKEVAQEVSEAVAKKTTATAPPEGFAGRVNESISDFLPFFQFAVNSISTSEDSKSVTVKLNTTSLGHIVLGFSGTAAEPEIFQKLADEIAEPVREVQGKALLGGISDFSDVTAAAEVGYLSRSGNWATSRKLFGRDARIYEDLISDYLAAAWAAADADIKQEATRSVSSIDDFAKQLKALDFNEPFGVTFQQIRDAVRQGTLQGFDEHSLRQALIAQAEAEAALRLQVSAAKISALPALIDNQPQIVFKALQRSSDDVVGPDSTVYSFSYEMGSSNFNALLREYRKRRPAGVPEDDPRAAKAKVDALNAVLSDPGVQNEEKLIFSFTYNDVDPYHFVHEYEIAPIDPVTGQDLPPVSRTAEVNLDRSTQIRGKLVYTRFIRFRAPALSTPFALPDPGSPDFWDKAIPKEQRPRLTISLESVDFRDDPTRRDQLIGKLSYVMPLSGGVTLPVTLVWANHKEFVGEHDRLFGAHVGLSYKLNRGGD